MQSPFSESDITKSQNRAAPIIVSGLAVLFLCLTFVGSGTKMKEVAVPAPYAKYDCSGGLEIDSKQGRKNIDQAIDDALDLLNRCEPCRRMFDSEDRDYAINLLQRMKKANAIIITSRIPTDWVLKSDGKKLIVKSTEPFGDAAAIAFGLLHSETAEMKLPCIYVNSAGFVVTGVPADGFALYGLEFREQGAVTILHELAHVAGVIQHDGSATNELRNKSVANTNCIRRNCVSCKEFGACPNVSEPLHKRRRDPKFKI